MKPVVNKDNNAGLKGLFRVPFKVVPLGFFKRGRLLYLKFLSLLSLLWAPGLLATHISGSLDLYVNGWSHFMFDLILCASIFLLADLCDQTVATIEKMDKITHHTNDGRFPNFIRKWSSSSTVWYVLCVFGGLMYSLPQIYLNAVGSPLHFPLPVWTDPEYILMEKVRVNSVYLLFENIITLLILGTGFNRYIHYLLVINDYGDKFLRKTYIDLLSPDVVKSLKPFQKLIVKSVFFISVPFTVNSFFLFEHLIRKGNISLLFSGLTVVYVVFFLFTLFNQMKWVRQVLLNAKREALSIIDERIRKVRANIEDEVSFLILAELFSFRDRLEKTSMWAFDVEIISKSSLALIMPIIAGAVIQIILEHFMIPLF